MRRRSQLYSARQSFAPFLFCFVPSDTDFLPVRRTVAGNHTNGDLHSSRTAASYLVRVSLSPMAQCNNNAIPILFPPAQYFK